jgi:hypothetical protein
MLGDSNVKSYEKFMWCVMKGYQVDEHFIGHVVLMSAYSSET